jgi:hypothetical protein
MDDGNGVNDPPEFESAFIDVFDEDGPSKIPVNTRPETGKARKSDLV